MHTRMARALLSAIVLIAGVSTKAMAQRRYTESLDTTVTLDRQATVDLSLFSGRVDVVGGSGSQAHIRATIDRGGIDFDAGPSRVRLSVDPSRGGPGDARYELTVPAGTRVLVNSLSGSISVRGVKGEVDANAVSGSIVVTDATRKVKAESVSGNVEVSQVAGDVNASSVSGRVQVDDVSGDLETESVSGRLTMLGIKSKFVRAGSVSGRISYGGTFAPDGSYEFKSHSGGVLLSLPSDVGAQVRIETFSGSVDSDFPVTLQPNADDRGSNRRMEFKIGNGRARIVAESFSGTIKLQRGDGRDSRN